MVNFDDIKEIENKAQMVSDAIINLVNSLEEIGFAREEVNKDVIYVTNLVDNCGEEIHNKVMSWIYNEKIKNLKK